MNVTNEQESVGALSFLYVKICFEKYKFVTGVYKKLFTHITS